MKTEEIKQMVTEERAKEYAAFTAEEKLTRPYRDIEYLCARGRIPPPIGWRKQCPQCGGHLNRRQLPLKYQGIIYIVYECPHCDYIYVRC